MCAVVKPGALLHSITGKVQGSVFRQNTYGLVLHSNNWAKRGMGMKHFNSRFELASLSSQWKGLSQADRDAWYQQDGSYLGKSQFTQFRSIRGSTKTKGA